MSGIYQSPLRVYLALGLLALIGLSAGLSLPISLFPNSAKPTVLVKMPYSNLSAEEFAHSYGRNIESSLKGLADPTLKVRRIETSYNSSEARFLTYFDWGVDETQARKEVQTVMAGLSAQLPSEIRNAMRIWSWSENRGFLAISLYSKSRSLDEVYNIVEPTLTPKLSGVKDASEAGVYNPDRKEILVELKPDAMAAAQILPRDVADAIEAAISSYNGGSLTLNANNLTIKLPRAALSLEELKRSPLLGRSGKALFLNDVANVKIQISPDSSRSFRTSGVASLILFSEPAPGGNIKNMAEEILKIVNETQKEWPPDIEHRVLVDPSEFIRSSINNVLHEVLLAAGLAVLILFLFVGNLRNVITAAIEIPLSIVLAFILMRLFGININLISLGGLALSAGMNVDASVVVMENIFRHFELHKGRLGGLERLQLVSQAVAEVRLPIIASTIASVVVFLPLAFTSNFSYAILGDLAKTVVFSHSFSAVVALILVPTIRLQLMKTNAHENHTPPIERLMVWLEHNYIRLLTTFLHSKKIRSGTYLGLTGLLILLFLVVLPRLPKEIIGLPDTDWMMISIQTSGNSQIQQMDNLTAKIEHDFMSTFAKKFSYTFTQTNNINRSFILARLKNKSQTQSLLSELETYFKNTPLTSFRIMPWNPSELPIPDPPEFQLSIRGGAAQQRMDISEQISHLIQDQKRFSRVWLTPPTASGDAVLMEPHIEQWPNLVARGARLGLNDLADISRVATTGRQLGSWTVDNRTYNLTMRYPQQYINSPEDLGALPLGLLNKVIPLKALAQVKLAKEEPVQFRVDEQDVVELYAKLDRLEKGQAKEITAATTTLVKDWLTKNRQHLDGVSVQFDDPQAELNDALHQLSIAIGLSIVLIFLIMVFQLGDIISSLLVMVAIPLGFIGVILSLFVFGSTLSLNSALGVILLNGLAVANSIILVDFFNKLIKDGVEIKEAAITAAKARLRPILMTSLTTAIGMLPIALGMGDGGRILQPLGIAISGGLWFSMSFTLLIVPTLQVGYFEWQQRKRLTTKFTVAEVRL